MPDLTAPYAVTWPHEWDDQIEAFGYVETDAIGFDRDEAEALRCEGVPWPRDSSLGGRWDPSEGHARALAPLVYQGRHSWGVLMLGSSRGPRFVERRDSHGRFDR